MSVLEGTFDAYHRKVCAYMLNTLSSAGVGEIHFINEVCCYHNSASSGRYCDKQHFVILCVSHENKEKYLPVFLTYCQLTGQLNMRLSTPRLEGLF